MNKALIALAFFAGSLNGSTEAWAAIYRTTPFITPQCMKLIDESPERPLSERSNFSLLLTRLIPFLVTKKHLSDVKTEQDIRTFRYTDLLSTPEGQAAIAVVKNRKDIRVGLNPKNNQVLIWVNKEEGAESVLQALAGLSAGFLITTQTGFADNVEFALYANQIGQLPEPDQWQEASHLFMYLQVNTEELRKLPNFYIEPLNAGVYLNILDLLAAKPLGNMEYTTMWTFRSANGMNRFLIYLQHALYLGPQEEITLTKEELAQIREKELKRIAAINTPTRRRPPSWK